MEQNLNVLQLQVKQNYVVLYIQCLEHVVDWLREALKSVKLDRGLIIFHMRRKTELTMKLSPTYSTLIQF